MEAFLPFESLIMSRDTNEHRFEDEALFQCVFTVADQNTFLWEDAIILLVLALAACQLASCSRHGGCAGVSAVLSGVQDWTLVC